MLRSKNLQISSDEPQLLNLDFGKSRNIKTGNHGHYPYFTALELDHLDNKQADLEQTPITGGNITNKLKKITTKALDKAKDKAKKVVTQGARQALEKEVDKKKDETVKALKKHAKNNIDDLIGHIALIKMN